MLDIQIFANTGHMQPEVLLSSKHDVAVGALFASKTERFALMRLVLRWYSVEARFG